MIALCGIFDFYDMLLFFMTAICLIRILCQKYEKYIKKYEKRYVFVIKFVNNTNNWVVAFSVDNERKM